MADRIIKGDSGNDVIIQNNDASRKIEVTNSGDVEVTGDVKTTTVKATNLKANDGTAGLVVADSTGEVTSSGGLKATNVKTTNLKANDGTAGLVIADSTGRVSFSENNPVITLGSNATFPSGHIIQIVESRYTDTTSINTTSFTSILNFSITRASTANKILVIANVNGGTDNHGFFQLQRSVGSGSYTTVLNGATATSYPNVSFGYAQTKSTNTANTITLTGLDSPGTTDLQVNYKLGAIANSTSNPIFINRTQSDLANSRAGSRSVTSIRLIEVVG